MQETYNLSAIIIGRQRFRERDSKVILYSKERGKLQLVARGTSKTFSKIAPHVEPFNLSKVMAVRGKQYDYVGSAICKKCFINIKSDLDKLYQAGKAMKVFNKLIKDEDSAESDNLYNLLKKYLDLIDNSDISKVELLYSFFMLKLLSYLGYKPELEKCIGCNGKSESGVKYFDYKKGGVVCGKCKGRNRLNISGKSIEILIKIVNNDLGYIEADNENAKEIKKAIESFYSYNF